MDFWSTLAQWFPFLSNDFRHQNSTMSHFFNSQSLKIHKNFFAKISCSKGWAIKKATSSSLKFYLPCFCLGWSYLGPVCVGNFFSQYRYSTHGSTRRMLKEKMWITACKEEAFDLAEVKGWGQGQQKVAVSMTGLTIVYMIQQAFFKGAERKTQLKALWEKLKNLKTKS